MNYSVRLSKVTKRYKMHKKNSDKLKDLLYPNGYGEDFYAVQNIDLLAEPGDVIGLIGINGSGKSTISNLIGGITPPTSGTVDVKGEVALIAVAAGLNKDLTGRENIELKCLMMGFTKKEIDRMKPDIIEFADIGKFIDMPVKKYSSGMKSRLGFAISISVDPDVLIIDEALSVGDKTFADKCLSKMNEYKAQGKTIFFVSHSAGQMKKFCTKALWLEHGEVREYGTIEEVMPRFENFVKEYNKLGKEEKKQFKDEGIRKQSGEIAPLSNEVEAQNEWDQSLSRVRGTRKKRSSGKFIYACSIAVIVMVLSFGYGQRDKVMEVVGEFTTSTKSVDPATSTMVDTSEETEAAVVEKENNPVAELDIRYVDVARARVRSAPGLGSSEVTLLEFAHPYKVVKTEKDESSNMSWSSTILADGSDVWISDTVSKQIPFKNAMDYDQFLSMLEAITPLSSIESGADLLGESKFTIEDEVNLSLFTQQFTEVEGTSYNSSLMDLVLNGDEKVSKVTIHNFAFSIKELLDKFGEAHLSDEFSSVYLYRTDTYDFFFHSNDGVTISDITMVSLLDL